MAVKDIWESLEASWKARIVSPLAGALIISWFVWNYRLIFILFSEMKTRMSFAYIDYVLYPDLLTRLTYQYVGPVATALLYLYGFTPIADKVLKYVHRQTLKRNKEIQQIDGLELLTVEQSAAMRKQVADAKAESENRERTAQEELERVRESRNAMQEHSFKAQKKLGQSLAEGIAARPDQFKMRMAAFLTSRSFTFAFNPQSASGAKRMTFGKNGEVLEGANNNETRWSLDDSKLIFHNSEGNVYSKFSFDPASLGFVSAPDSSTVVATAQNMTPAEVQGYE